MIPIRDANPSATVPIVTVGLIIANALVWMFELSLGHQAHAFITHFGVVPHRILNYEQYSGGFTLNVAVPLFTSMFMHAGWLHIIGNMWFLWLFGDNVEDKLGHVRFLIFYLACGVGSAVIHTIMSGQSQIPVIGASGAISGVLGAYLVSFPNARVLTLYIIIILVGFIELPAYIFLIVWFMFQLLSGMADARAGLDAGGVAWWAHIGGFVLGAVLLWLIPERKGFRDRSQRQETFRRRLSRGW